MTMYASLSKLAEINPRIPAAVRNGDVDRLVPFLPMSVVSEEGRAVCKERRPIAELQKGYTYFQRGDVLLAKITPCLENGKAAILSDLPDEFGFGSTEFHVLRPGPDIDPRYLFHAVWNRAFRRAAASSFTGSAGQKRVPASFFDRYRIPVPALAEQRRIAAVLDKADAIRRKRRESQRLLDELLRATYLAMVGSLNKDHSGWPAVQIADIAESGPQSMRTGPFGSALRHSEFVNSGIAVLGIDNAVQNRFDWAERRFITPEKYEKLTRYTVKPGDVIVTIMGTTGRSAVVPDNIPLAISTKHLAVITVDRTRVHPVFLSFAIHADPAVLAQIASGNRGAIMAGLNLGIIRRLRLRVPPLDLQQRFAGIVRRVFGARNHVERATVEADHLFHALAHRALGGAPVDCSAIDARSAGSG